MISQVINFPPLSPSAVEHSKKARWLFALAGAAEDRETLQTIQQQAYVHIEAARAARAVR